MRVRVLLQMWLRSRWMCTLDKWLRIFRTFARHSPSINMHVCCRVDVITPFPCNLLAQNGGMKHICARWIQGTEAQTSEWKTGVFAKHVWRRGRRVHYKVKHSIYILHSSLHEREDDVFVRVAAGNSVDMRTQRSHSFCLFWTAGRPGA